MIFRPILILVCLLALATTSVAENKRPERNGVRPERAVSAPAKIKIPPKAKELTETRFEVEKWPNGNVRKRTPFKNGMIDGNVEEFFENGNPASVTPYVDGKINGEQVKYWDVNFVAVQSRINYVDNKMEGPAKNWHHNGNILSERTYKNGKLDGAERQYHPAANGKVKTQRYWQDGLQTATEARYDDQGRELSYFEYEDGKKHGDCYSFGFSHEIRWHEKWNHGALIERIENEYFHLAGGEKKLKVSKTFNNAHKLHGTSTYYRAPDILEKVLNFKNGKRDGKTEYFDETGKLIKTETWINGKKVEQQRPMRMKPSKR